MTGNLGILSSSEVLMYIFTFLSPKDLSKCRVVCLNWLQIIKSLTRNETLWRKHCRRDYPDICDMAYLKSQSSLSWYQLYRSLKIWPRLREAKKIRHEFAFAEYAGDEINNFQVLRDGVIAVHRSNGIIYYDLNTLQVSHRAKVTGSYREYRENDHIILTLDQKLHLSVTWKENKNTSNFATTFTLKHVKTLLLLENEVFYVTVNDEVHLCKQINGKIISSKLIRVPDGVQLLGYKNGFLHILTSRLTICMLVDGELTCVDHFKVIEIESVLRKLSVYNMLSQIEWKLLFRNLIPERSYDESACPLLHYGLTTLFPYGPVVLTGTNLGNFRIYYSPDDDDLSSLYKVKSLIYEYVFLERYSTSKFLISPIIRIDVVEGYDSHTVLVAFLNKIVAIQFIHDF